MTSTDRININKCGRNSEWIFLGNGKDWEEEVNLS